MSLPKLTSLSLGPATKPTYEMIDDLKKEAMSFPPGRFREALLNTAKRMQERLDKLDEMDRKGYPKSS